MKKLLLLVALLFVAQYSVTQTGKSSDIRQKVLQSNNIGKEYKFNTEGDTQTYLRYLEIIQTQKGERFKIMTSVWIWGQSGRATNRILIYSDNNRYLGNYYLTTRNDIPDRIQNNKLIFVNYKGSDCDPQLTTRIDFKNGIPKELFRKCKGDYGDIYNFSTE